MRICIDARHNYDKYDTGAVGNGLKEQEVTFKIADRLKSLLVSAGAEVTMTRDKLTDNVGVNAKDAINERARLANLAGCDYFISIHCNAGGGTGTETLIYGKGGKAEALAEAVNEKLVKHLGLRDRGIKVRPDLGVLRLTNMPAILVETAFIDNAKYAELLKTKTDEFAKCIFDGISFYCGMRLYISEPEEIVEKIAKMVEITDKKSAITAVSEAKAENNSLYWILYKIANM